MRVRMDLAYDGTNFHGWAVQPGLRTIQGEVHAALETTLRTPVVVTCAGRTDTGVHARGQVVHFDLPSSQLAQAATRGEPDVLVALQRRLNGIMDPDVRVRRVSQAPPGFEARFSALWRAYCYRIIDHPEALDPVRRNYVLMWPRQIDVEAMHEAAQLLVGKHDFAAYCKRREGATTVRRVLEFNPVRTEFGSIEVNVRADAFCHNMVRGLVGAAVAVGEGRRPASWVLELLQARVRSIHLHVLPARGLTLEEVRYPDDEELAAQAELTRARHSLEEA